MLQTTTQHDIVGALKILIKEAGKAFEKRVHRFGAVYVDKAKRRALLDQISWQPVCRSWQLRTVCL